MLGYIVSRGLRVDSRGHCLVCRAGVGSRGCRYRSGLSRRSRELLDRGVSGSGLAGIQRGHQADKGFSGRCRIADGYSGRYSRIDYLYT